MAKGYRFGQPHRGAEHNAFRTFSACKDFLQSQLESGRSEIVYEIVGPLIRDEGTPDGLVIKVESFSKYDTVRG